MRAAKLVSRRLIVCLLAGLWVAGCVARSDSYDPLPAWNPGPAKQALQGFVAAVIDPASPAFVPPAARVAVFDNDGTLWAEDPWPVPFEFIYFRIRQLAPANPEWRTLQPYQAVLETDDEWLRMHSRQAAHELSAAAQAGLTVDEYDALAQDFFAQARHPATGRLYTDMVYEPMLQLVQLLQKNEFEVYVVSGGDADFIRAYAQNVYGIPRSHVIGSRVGYKIVESKEGLNLVRQAETDNVNIGGFKVINIHNLSGRRPIFAAGNSDGDLKMLQYVSPARGLSMLLVHDDPEREFEQQSGYTLAETQAADSGWLIVSMRADFAEIFPQENTR